MGILSYIAGAITLIAGFSAPLSAAALGLGISFGGKLVSPPVPCVNIPGAYLVTISPLAMVPPKGALFVYTPLFTVGFPPSKAGQYILGTADIITVCNGAPAFRIQFDAVSFNPLGSISNGVDSVINGHGLY